MISRDREKFSAFLDACRVAILVCAVATSCSTARAGENKACSLLSSAEIEAATGLKVSGWKAQAVAGQSDAALCSGDAGTATVLLRVATKTGPAGREKKGIEIAKQMGAQVDVKAFGPVTCSTMVPPKSLEQYGFNTTCSVQKGSQVAAIEVTSKTEKDMVPIDKLRPLAEKMTARF